MPNPTETRILDELTERPGQTAKQIAEKFGWLATKASQQMGSLYFTNLLDRRAVAGHNQYTYSIRPPRVDAPRLVPLFETRMAGRLNKTVGVE